MTFAARRSSRLSRSGYRSSRQICSRGRTCWRSRLSALWAPAPCRARSRPRAATRARSAHDRVGEHARRLHLWPRADSAVRTRGGDGGAGAARLATARVWTTFALAALAAALIDPYGVDALLLPFRLMSVENLSRISEWRPQDFSHIGTMELALLTLLGFTLTRAIRHAADPRRAHRRARRRGASAFAPSGLLGVLAPMLLARPIAAAIGAGRAGEEWRQVARIALPATVAAVLAVGGVRLLMRIEPTDGATVPISALSGRPAEIETAPRRSMTTAFGGFLIFEHVRPFIDARVELYGDPMMNLYDKLRGGDREAVESALKRYDIAWTIFAPGERIVALLDREPGWRRLYAEFYGRRPCAGRGA